MYAFEIYVNDLRTFSVLFFIFHRISYLLFFGWCDSADNFNLVERGSAVGVGEDECAGDGEADWEWVLAWEREFGGVVERYSVDRAWRQRYRHGFAGNLDLAFVAAHWARYQQRDDFVDLEVEDKLVRCGERCAERNVVRHADLFTPVPGAFV